MAQTCNRCSRVNPDEASYCYFDGQLLAGGNGKNGGGPVNIGAQRFPNKFVFPGGKSCQSFDELAIACQENWKAALDVLQQGYLESFLSSMGRSDLAMAAREAAKFPDRDRGLDQFLSKLPSDAVKQPQLAVEPTDINLGQLQVGQDRKIELHLRNQGGRLIYGTVSVEDCLWLTVGDKGGSQKLFQFGTELTLPVTVRSKQLRASHKPLQGTIVIDCNAGRVTINVRGDMPVKPYPDGVLAGAKSPRQIAEKAKSHPKEAAALFQSGSVAKWYKDNGWAYPVQGPSASGLGAVQQFFEALGLTPPPKVDISHRAITIRGAAGSQAKEAIEVKTMEKRPVYAHAVSDQAWLDVSKVQLNGRIATIPLVVNKVPNQPGQTLKATVTVRANGNQRFKIPVTLEVGGGGGAFPMGGAPAGAFTGAAPQSLAFSGGPDGAAPMLSVARRRPTSKKHLLPAALLLGACLAVTAFDFVAPSTGNTDSGGIVDFGPDENVELIEYDGDALVALTFKELNQRFGIGMTKENDPRNPGEKKRLTYAQDGSYNNTCVKIDGYENLFGQNPGEWARDKQGYIKQREVIPGRKWVSTWKFPQNVYVTQTIMIVPNDATKKLDTCLIHYLMDNRDSRSHTAGLRIMLDTFIGANDGVPFVIPGRDGLMDTKVDIKNTKDIPDFIQALENADLANPGTIANCALKLPSGVRLNPGDPELEPVTRLVISRFPGNPEIRWDFVNEGKFWDMNDKSKGMENDSCITAYWELRPMVPKEKRAMAITYGLGKISSLGKNNSKLALTYGGQPQPGKEITVTAWLRDATPNQRVRLALPAGMTFASGSTPEQIAAKGSGRLSQTSWKVEIDKGAKPAIYALTATSEGERESVDVRVRTNFGGLFQGK